MPSLTPAEAVARAALLTVTSMTVDLDLDRGAEQFGSTCTVAFDASELGAQTFVDLKAVTVERVELNGIPLDPASVVDGRLPLTDLAADNTLFVEATMAYSRDGQGLHRATDPADGQGYVYGHLFLDAGPAVFACFDQPDLKAPYAVTVTAPLDWAVLGNGAATQTSPGRWTLATTHPLATYFVTVCAGPWAAVRAEHDGIPLGVHARASLREVLERESVQILEVTRQSLDYFHGLFGIRYPYGEYHQVFVPEFNAGAMENPGCVVLRDPYLHRGAATRDEVLTRANTISHEMAHMWFGNLVTMAWWDDLWLNESFAEYMAYRCLVEATEFSDAWVEATIVRKAWGYAAERTPSTHPVAAAPAADAASALHNFDGISYAKGASVLRQLIAYIGDGAFIAGTTAYLREFADANAGLADYLGALEKASGRDLATWSAAWLRTVGADRLALDPSTGTLTRTPPPDHPADRPHTLDVAGYDGGAEAWRIRATVAEPSQVVDGVLPARLVIPNAGDLTWATTTLDPGTLAALPTELARVPDAQARAVVWLALLDGVALATVDPRHLLATFGTAWPVETNPAILSQVVGQVTARVIPCFLPPQELAAATEAVAVAARALLDASADGSSAALAAARALAAASSDADLLGAWSVGDGVPAGLEGDDDFGWLVVGRLAELGHVDDAGIDAVLAGDQTMTGRLAAFTARAAQPTAAAKAWAWGELTTNRSLSNYDLNSLATGFWRSTDAELVRSYAERYFADLPAMSQWVGDDALFRVAELAYPSRVVEPVVAALGEAALSRHDLSPGVRRAMVDCHSRMEESLRSRAVFD